MASTFAPRAVPRVARQPERTSALSQPPLLPLYNAYPASTRTLQIPLQKRMPFSGSPGSDTSPVSPVHELGPAKTPCACEELSLGQNWPQAREHTPLWLYTPAWDAGWGVAEIRREECRRLCWSTLTLAAGYTSYAAALRTPISDLFVIQPSNVSSPLFSCFNLTLAALF